MEVRHQSGAERSLDGTPVHSFGNFDFAVAMRYLLPPFRNLGFGALLNAGCALRQTQGRLSGISCPALSRSRYAKLVLEQIMLAFPRFRAIIIGL